MSRYRLYSDRLKDAAKAGNEDIYQYDNVPQKVRVQIRQIVAAVLGAPEIWTREEGSVKNRAAAGIREIVCREKGIDYLAKQTDPLGDLLASLEILETEGFLDVLEVTCVTIQGFVGRNPYWKEIYKSTLKPDEAIDDINFRLRDAGVGFQFEDGHLIRVDSMFLHSEVTKPALSLLNRNGFEGPQQEFLSGHDHFKAGNFKEAITDAAKAFESTMKAICDLKGWEYPKKGRATDLLKVLRQHGLWPDYLDGSFDQLIATLSSGLPQVRNDDAAHGQGAEPRAVPEYVAAYALHLAAAKIVLMVEAATKATR